ncbi:preprotein translocase subunit SecY [bacterium]|nr:preprotein translocase subunit SecY [bacterium]
MFETLKKAINTPDIRKKLLITFGLLVAYRIVAHIPLPGINRDGLSSLFASSQLLGLVDVFSGGSLSRFSLSTIGIGPYISASIAMQMFTYTIPSLKELTKEGLYGQEKINRYTKYLTLPVAIIQSFGIYILFQKQGLFPQLAPIDLVSLIVTLVAGSFVVMWIGDLITEQNLGNGISLIVLVGIISSIPISSKSILLGFQSGDLVNIIFTGIISFLVVMGAIYVNEAARKIPIAYASSNKASYSGDSFLPLKINQAGVIPIIFAVAIVLIPSFLGNVFVQSSAGFLNTIGTFLNYNFAPNSSYYNILYFLSVFFFTFVYTALTFNPEDIAENLKNRGGYIPGIRPGRATVEYLNNVLTRVTFVGAMFLGLIAILPNVASSITGVTSITIGGAGVLIVVSVVLESIKQIESQVIMHEYSNVGLN